MKVYSKKDLEEKRDVIAKAQSIWSEKCVLNYREHGDQGSCVMGAGIAISYMPDRRYKHPKTHVIISADSVAACQGSLNWESSVEEIIEYLKENGFETYYYPGILD